MNHVRDRNPLGELPVVPAVPDVAGEINGWRAWRVVGTRSVLRLAALNDHGDPPIGSVWPTSRWFVARCETGADSAAHVAPHERCRCGIYALTTRELVIERGFKAAPAQLQVIGEVALAGRVIPAESGFRAEKARVVRLVVPYERWQVARVLGAAYRVPVELGNLVKAA